MDQKTGANYDLEMDFQSFLAREVGDENQEDFKSAKIFNSCRLKSQEPLTPYLGLQTSIHR